VNWRGLVIAGIAALFIAFFGAFLVVASQSPASSVEGPGFVYGSPSIAAP
jgi:hypothetical protein